MGDTSYSDLQQGDARAYDAIGLTVETNAAPLVIPFRAAGNAAALLGIVSTGDFFQKFLGLADQFSDSCCRECAEIVLLSTVVAEVRGLATVTLAGEIRKDVFEPLDRRIEALKELKSERDRANAIVRGDNLSDQMRGHGLLLLKQGDAVIVQAIGEYLQMLTDLPEPVLNLCCVKCFGSRVSVERQQQSLERVKAAMAREFDPVIQRILALPETGRQAARASRERVKGIKEADWENDPTSPKLWIKFFKVLGLIFLIMLIIGMVISVLLPKE